MGHRTHRCGRQAASVAAIIAAVVWWMSAQQRPDTSTGRLSGQPPRTILALGDVSTAAWQHDSVSHALAMIEDLGLRSGLYDTSIRTDTQLVTKGAIAAATGTLTFYKNLDDFDAVVMFVGGEPRLSPQQKSDLLSFVREGKGLVAIHSTISAFQSWPEFAEMLGGRAVERPTEVAYRQIAVLARGLPAMSLFPKSFGIRDNISPVFLNTRGRLRVLAKSGDTPVIWTRTYGKGRVFVSQLGHEDEVWDRKDVQHLMVEAIRWVMEGHRGAVTSPAATRYIR